MTAANAVDENDPVALLIRADLIQPMPPTSPNDGLTFTGRPAISKDITGCGVGSFPQQQAALVDMDGQSGLVTVIVTSETDPMRAGTEVQDLIRVSECTIETDGLYVRYTGIVTRAQ